METIQIRESAENYLETILVLQKRHGHARSIDIANELSFSKPSVSVAMKNLRLNGLIEIDEDGIITLQEAGRVIAERIYERHTLLTQDPLVFHGIRGQYRYRHSASRRRSDTWGPSASS